MIELPQLWLPDRLRQRREDERLLRGRHGVSRRWMPGYPCCCNRCPCCEGSPPDYLEISISGVVNAYDQTDCDTLNDTFILDFHDCVNRDFGVSTGWNMRYVHYLDPPMFDAAKSPNANLTCIWALIRCKLEGFHGNAAMLWFGYSNDSSDCAGECLETDGTQQTGWGELPDDCETWANEDIPSASNFPCGCSFAVGTYTLVASGYDA